MHLSGRQFFYETDTSIIHPSIPHTRVASLVIPYLGVTSLQSWADANDFAFSCIRRKAILLTLWVKTRQ